MKAFACGDVVPGCQARWVCASDDEIMVSVTSHAVAVHGLAEIPEALMLEVRDHIVSTA
jgi:predicted small metal-binding protein